MGTVDVLLRCEENLLAPGVFTVSRPFAWVPEMTGELAVRDVKEGRLLIGVLTDEYDERWAVAACEPCVTPHQQRRLSQRRNFPKFLSTRRVRLYSTRK